MTVYYTDDQVTLHHGDAFAVAQRLASGSVDCIVTSPPYFGLRDYGTEGQYGLEATPAEYVERMRALFAEMRRVLADDGTLWLNIGDSYAGSWGNQGHNPHRDDFHTKQRRMGAFRESATRTGSIRPGMPAAKNLMGIPWRVAFALQDDGWILRNAIVWHKPNAMPESVTDRLSSRYEHVFLFSKSRRYWFDLDAIREPHSDVSIKRAAPHRSPPGKASRAGLGFAPGMKPQTLDLDQMNHQNGRNPGDVWTMPTQPFPGAHFAVYPVALPQRCILAGCKPGGTVLDPFNGSGTTGLAAQRTGRRYVGIDLNAEYLDLSLNHPQRLKSATLDFEAGA